MTHPSLKVGVVVQKFGLVGGGEQFVAEVTRRLARHPRLAIHVFANEWIPDGAAAITFHHVSMPSIPRWRKPEGFARRVQRAVDREGIDLIHAHERIFEADVYSAHGIPHPFWVETVRGKRMNAYDRRLARVEERLLNSSRLTNVLPVSSIAAEQIAAAYPRWADRMTLAHPGVDRNRFKRSRSDEERRWLREQCGWPPDARVVLFVGMNFEIKGLATLLEAQARANRDLEDGPYYVAVIGKGDQRRYARLADRLGQEARVRFVGIATDDLPRWYQGADLFAMVSQFDTFGLTVLEAMACGLPVIVSDRVGARDLVQSRTNGWVVPAGDHRAVADALTDGADPDRRSAMADAAERVADANGWTACARKVLNAYGAAAGIPLDDKPLDTID